ncbi:MurT ligase domain-containing protein [Caldisericum exile]|nr:MurT ligase domain-containing protein [Caldisericum exile]
MIKKIQFYLAIGLGIIVKNLLKISGHMATSLPGLIAYFIYPDILKEIGIRCKIKIFVTGTNGKTTTNYLIKTILSKSGSVLYNEFGANMISGIVSAFISNLKQTYEYCTFEIDEGTLPKIAKQLKPDIVVVTNIFRDQLDRYAEIEIIRKKIFEGIGDSVGLLNGDDPSLNLLKGENKFFYSIEVKNELHDRNITLDVQFCPVCGTKLNYEYYTIGHLGKFICPQCGFSNNEPRFLITNVRESDDTILFDFIDKKKGKVKDLNTKRSGIYQLYNISAALSCAMILGIDFKQIKDAVKNFSHRLGRYEEIVYQNKKIIINLVKNPVSLSETLYTIARDTSRKIVVFILNDNYADGKDVSWIWDADFEILSKIENIKKIYCDGKRKEEIKLRLKYTSFDIEKCVLTNLKENIFLLLNEDVEKLYFLPTYTALFETRNIILNAINEVV